MKQGQSLIPFLNPYLDLYQILSDQSPQLQLLARKKLIWAYSWAIPSLEGIHAISQYSPIVELGAGTGYWAWLLSQVGAQVTAFDHEPLQVPRWHSIEQGDESMVHRYSDRALFLCWPPF